MTSDNAIKALLVWALILPAALIMGYLVATPLDAGTVVLLGSVLLVLISPLLLKWHHPMLFLCWNMALVVFFLPGQPDVSLVMAFVSLIFALVERAMSKEMQFISVPSLSFPLIYILLVTLVTAKFTGGFGLRVLGTSTVGGRAYLYILAAVAGFRAMTAHRVPLERAPLYVALFFLGALPAMVSSLIPLGPQDLYFLSVLFPVSGNDMTSLVGSLDPEGGFVGTITRFFGITFACQGALLYMLARYGLEGIFSVKHPMRLGLLLALGIGACMGGYRSTFLLLALVFICLFFLEGLFRLKYVIGLSLVLTLAAALLVPVASKLPLPIQRTLSILPLDVNPIARFEAETSNEWRLEMWRTVWPLVPQHLWFGKGLSMNAEDMVLTADLAKRGFISSQEQSILSGTYHNGGLTVLIPFGIWGAAGLLWFLIAAIRALYLNYRYGDDSLKAINSLLLAFFLAKMILYFGVFGDFKTDLALFAGLVGLSVVLNGGIRNREKPVVKVATEPEAAGELVVPAKVSPSLT